MQFSTSVATFARFSDPPAVDVYWLYEWLYFSNAMRDTTSLTGIYRMSPATVCDVLDPDFIREIRDREVIHWQKLIATAEIVFRLAANGWNSEEIFAAG